MPTATVNLLAISGSARALSTNTAMLRAIAARAPAGVRLSVFHRLDQLPVFSPDAEGEHTPAAVLDLLDRIAAADGLIIASPEYVRSIPGGLKNAIDWMVSRPEIIAKPIALAHASHRGDDMLTSLRRVLGTVSQRFMETPFLRLPLLGHTPDMISSTLAQPDQARAISGFLAELVKLIRVPPVAPAAPR